MGKFDAITNAVNTFGKQLSDIGQYIKNTAKSMSQTPTTQTAAHNMAKWGAPLAGIGIGTAGLGIGASAGLSALSAGVDNTIAPKVENVSKIGGLLILVAIVFIVAKYILPELKGVLK
jgi:hypothetical protein